MYDPRGITPTKMRGSKFPADMYNYLWCPIYIPSFMKIGSVVSEELLWQDFGTDGRTDGRSDCTPRPAFAFGDAGKNTFRIPSENVCSIHPDSISFYQWRFRMVKLYYCPFLHSLMKRFSEILINTWRAEIGGEMF